MKIKAWILEEILKAVFLRFFFLSRFANIILLQAAF